MFTIGVKAISFAKELIVAQAFGTGDALDAFLVAFGLTNYLAAVVAMPFGSAMLPSFVREREQAGESRPAPACHGGAAGAGAGGRRVGAAGGARPAAAAADRLGFAASKLALTFGMLLVLAPSVLLAGLNELASTTAQPGRSLCLHRNVGRGGADCHGGQRAAAAPATACTRWRWACWPAWRFKACYAALAARRRFALAALETAGRPRWRACCVLAGRGRRGVHNNSVLIDELATPLGSGSVAVLNYGNNLVALVQGVGAAALGVAILP